MNRAFEMPGKQPDDRVGVRRSAEKWDQRPFRDALIDDDADMRAAHQRAGDLQGGAAVGGDELLDEVAPALELGSDEGVSRRPVERRDRHAEATADGG